MAAVTGRLLTTARVFLKDLSHPISHTRQFINPWLAASLTLAVLRMVLDVEWTSTTGPSYTSLLFPRWDLWNTSLNWTLLSFSVYWSRFILAVHPASPIAKRRSILRTIAIVSFISLLNLVFYFSGVASLRRLTPIAIIFFCLVCAPRIAADLRRHWSIILFVAPKGSFIAVLRALAQGFLLTTLIAAVAHFAPGFSAFRTTLFGREFWFILDHWLGMLGLLYIISVMVGIVTVPYVRGKNAETMANSSEGAEPFSAAKRKRGVKGELRMPDAMEIRIHAADGNDVGELLDDLDIAREKAPEQALRIEADAHSPSVVGSGLPAIVEIVIAAATKEAVAFVFSWLRSALSTRQRSLSVRLASPDGRTSGPQIVSKADDVDKLLIERTLPPK